MADTIITLPDGSTIAFPAGTPDNVINREAANAWMKAQSAAKPAGERSLPERVGEAVNTGVNYVGTRATDVGTAMLGLPRLIGDLSATERPEPQGAIGRWAKGIHEAIDPTRFLRQYAPSTEAMREKVYGDWGVPRVDSGNRAVDASVEGAIGMLPGGAGVLPRAFTGAMSGAGSEIARQEAAQVAPQLEIPAAIAGALAGAAGGAGLAKAGQVVRNVAALPSPQIGADALMKRAMIRDADTPAAMRARLQQAGDGAMIADIGGSNLQGSAKVIAGMPGAGQNAANEALSIRNAGSPQRIMEQVRTNVSSRDYVPTVDDLMSQRSRAAAQAYEAAGIPSDPGQFAAARMIDPDVVKRLVGSSEDVAAAIKQAQRLPQYKDLPENSAVILDKARKNIQGKVDAAKRAGDNEHARDLTYLKGLVDDALGTDYKAAVRNFAEDSSVIAAADKGRDAIRKNMSPDAVGKTYRDMTPDEQELFRAGYAEELRKAVGNTREGGNAVGNIWSRPEQRDRAREILGNDFAAFNDQMNREILFRRTFDRMGVDRGSRTAPLNAAAEDQTGALADFAGRAARGGPRQAAIDAAVRFVENSVLRRAQGYNDLTNAELASRYFTSDRAAQEALLRRLDEIRPPQSLLSVGRDAMLPASLTANERR